MNMKTIITILKCGVAVTASTACPLSRASTS